MDAELIEEPGGPLAALGISARAERLYRIVLRAPGERLRTIVDRSGRPYAEVEADLIDLAAVGLVRRSGEEVWAEPPERTLGRLLTAESQRLIQAEDALAVARLELHSYVAEHLAGQSHDHNPVSFQVIEPTEVLHTMRRLVRETSGEMLFFRPDQWRLPSGREMDDVVIAELASGRPSRALYPHHILDGYSAAAQQRASAGEEVRVLKEVPSRMSVFGTAVVVPELWGAVARNLLVIRQQAVVEICRTLFENAWSHAVSVRGWGTPEPGDRERHQLVELLGRGVKDDVIARVTGLSLRTVRRRVAELMRELGADSRFEAGAEAVRRGWL